MAALPDRDSVEARLLKALAKANTQAQRRITEALGNPPDVNNVSADVWAEIETTLRGALVPELEAIYMTAAEAASAELGIGFAWDTVNTNAATWARQYGFDLVRGINDNSRAMLQQSIGGFFETPLTNVQLQEKLGRVFGASRAESIAITEVTRAASEGERAAAADLANQGVRTVQVFQTSADDRVCAICGPADGKRSDQPGFQYPPLHVRCRCSVRSEVVIPE
jgi:hypothetical protein